MRRLSSRLRFCAAASVLALLAAPAAAGSVIAFGDSLSDSGNLFAVTRGLAPPSPPYAAGRFSNGLTFAEIAAGGPMQPAGARVLGGLPVNRAASQNYAFGGAVTGRTTTPVPGVPNQIDLFQAAGGRFGPGDLALLSGGPNDVFQTLAAIGAGAPVATLGTASLGAAANTAGSADRLAQLGAPTIAVVNMPDLGLIPRLRGDVVTSTLGQQATALFNADLAGRLAGVAAARPNTDIVLVDANRLFLDALAHPGRYGFADVTRSCLATPGCAAGSAAAQDSFLFFDDVHPTASAHRLYGLLVLDYLTAGEQAGQAVALSEVAFADRLAGESAVRDRARTLLAGTNAIAQGADLTEPGEAPISYGGAYVSLEGSAFDRDASGPTGGYDYRAGTLRVGADHRPSDRFLFGGAVSASRGEVRDAPFGFDTQSYAADLYGTAVFGPAFLTVTGGVARFDFDDIHRQSFVPQIVQNGRGTDAVVANAGAELGYGLGLGAFTATPTLGLSYVHFDVDGIAEDGAAARIVYAAHRRDVVYGAANLHLSYTASLAGRRTVLTGRIGYEDALSEGGDDALVSRVAGSPQRPSRAAFGDVPGRGFVLGAGAELDLAERLALSVRYSAGFGDDEIGTSHLGSVSLGYRF